MNRTDSRVRALKRARDGDVFYDAKTGDFFCWRSGERIGGSTRRTYAELLRAGLTEVHDGEGLMPLRLTEQGLAAAHDWGVSVQIRRID